jgi:predicted nucleotidyltransferase/DNA-binding XRE family transcriptional regulator
MDTLGKIIRKLRTDNKLSLRVVAAFLDMDQAILSKIEHGKRKPNRDQVLKMAEYFKVEKDDLLVAWMADKVLYELGDDELALKVLQVAEDQVAYRKFVKIDRGALLRKLIDTLKQFDGIKKAWIYGSFAREDDGPKSDVDVAILTEPNFSYYDLGEVQFQAENALQRKVDVGFMESFKPHVLENVKSDLKLIYEKK